jgi:hypothetical protein
LPAQQWLLRGNSGPSFATGGPPWAGDLVEERASLIVSRLVEARRSSLFSLANVVLLHLLQDNIFCAAKFRGFKIPLFEVPSWIWCQLCRMWPTLQRSGLVGQHRDHGFARFAGVERVPGDQVAAF